MKTFFITISCCIFISYIIKAQNIPLKNYQSAFLAQNTYPTGLESVDWFSDDIEVQGVTNDGSNWFFTIVNQGSSFYSFDVTEGYLWKIPKNVPLQGNVLDSAGVMVVKATDIDELNDSMHYHWGDPDHVNYLGVDYILVPIYTIVACFRADNLEYVNYANFDGSVGGGWCAVGKDMGLYSSADDPTSIVRYEVDWNKLINTHEHDALSNPVSFNLFQADGSPLYMTDMQGGEFTPDGEMLYLVSGRGACLEWLGVPGAEWTPRDGIHAIVTQDWTEISQSTKSSEMNIYFSYNYDPTCIFCEILGVPVGGGTDTPEGLTFWDLEDGSAPGINGSLHVLVDRYLTGSIACDDELTFHHFSKNVFVDHNTDGNGPGLLGRIDHPFKTLPDAINYYPVWDGANVIITAGEYPTGGNFIINKRVRLSPLGGTVIIK